MGYVTLTDANTRFPMNVNEGIPAVGKALTVACDRCFVVEGEPCHNPLGDKVPPHVSRARAARWAQMFEL